MIAVFKKIAAVSQGLLHAPEQREESFAKSVKLLQKNIKSQATVFIISDFLNFDEELKKPWPGCQRKRRSI